MEQMWLCLVELAESRSVHDCAKEDHRASVMKVAMIDRSLRWLQCCWGTARSAVPFGPHLVKMYKLLLAGRLEV